MKILKENFKSIIAFVIGAILTGGITAYAAMYRASDIQYTNNKTVANALDDLYTKANTEIANLQSSNNYLTNQLASLDSSGAHGDITTSDDTTVHSISIGFRPSKVLFVIPNATTGLYEMWFYDSTLSSTEIKGFWGSSSNLNSDSGGATHQLSLFGLTFSDDGFTYKAPGTADTGKTYWYAIK